MHTARLPIALVACLLSLFGSACEGERGAAARKRIVADHAPRVAAIVREDLERHARGLQAAADRMVAPGFVKAAPEKLETEMRKALVLVRNPKRGIADLVISPMSFIAAVDANGIVVAREVEPDGMKGMNLAQMFPSVKKALAGEAAQEIGQFENPKKDGDPSVTILMAAPAHYEGKVVGALVLGIPLWRLQQRLTKQLQMEAAGKDEGAVLWVYVYRGDKLHKKEQLTSQALDQAVPDGAARRAGLAKSPGGFTGEVQLSGFWYGYGVKPLRMLGDDVGVVLFRMDPR